MAAAAFILMTSNGVAQFDTLSVGNRRYVQINEEQALELIENQNTTIQLLANSGDSLVQTLVHAMDSIGALNGSLTAAADSIGTLNGSLATATDSIGVLNSSLATATDSIGELNSSLTTAADSIGALNGSLTAAADSISVLNGSLATATDSNGVLNSSLATATDSIGVLNGSLTAAADSIGVLNGSLATAIDSIVVLTGSLTTAADSIGALNGSLTTAADSIGALNGSLTAAADSIGALNGSLTAAADSIGALNGSLNAAADSIGVLNLAYQVLEDSLTSLFSVPGCTYATYLEYNPMATWEDGSCEVIAIPGCMDDAYMEYHADANTDDGSCATIIVEGCLNYLYAEFEAAANVDDGSCATYLCNSVTFDGYAYDLVQINDQCWFAENLQTTVTAAGTPIPYVTNSTEWSTATGGAQNYANNSEANLASYGRLYNGYAATHSEGICPTGWHVSSLADWDSLTQFMTDEGYGNFLGMALRASYDWETASGGLSTTTLGWDTYGFKALPAGAYTGSNWMFVSRAVTSFWTSNKVSSTRAAVKELAEWDTGITHYSSVSFGNGKSIRCVIDRP